MNEGKKSGLRCCQPQNRGIVSMVAVFGVVVAVIILAYLSFGNNSKAEPSLRFLSIIHRHGERNPTATFPTDPYGNESIFWPEGYGQITKEGIVTMYELGKSLRARYDGFIPSRYVVSDLQVLASSGDRMIMSSQALLAGLYPPIGNQIWNPDIMWQPIPIHTLEGPIDDMFRVSKPCPMLRRELKRVEDAYDKKLLSDHQELVDFVQKKIGLDVNTTQILSALYDYLLIVDRRGLPLPEWSRSIYSDILEPLSLIWRSRFSATTTLKRLFSGVLINDLVTNMKMKQNSEKKFGRQLNQYSVSDRNIMNLWRSLGVKQQVPIIDFGATFIIELHEISNKYRVKILYKKHGLAKEWDVLNINGCEKDSYQDMCDFEVFLTALKPVLDVDFDKECQIENDR